MPIERIRSISAFRIRTLTMWRLIRPQGGRLTILPPAKHVDVKALVYDLKTANEDGKLQFKRELTVNLGMAESKYYGSLRTFFQNVRSSDDRQAYCRQADNVASLYKDAKTSTTEAPRGSSDRIIGGGRWGKLRVPSSERLKFPPFATIAKPGHPVGS
jgi:hypothetical protein